MPTAAAVATSTIWSTKKTCRSTDVTGIRSIGHVDISSDNTLAANVHVRVTEAVVPCAAALAAMLSGHPVDVMGLRSTHVIQQPVVELSRVRRAVASSSASVMFKSSTDVLSSVDIMSDMLNLGEIANEAKQQMSAGEAVMVSESELLHREKYLKLGINGTVALVLLCVMAALFGLFSPWALIPGIISAFGVIGSCAIQLIKVDESRRLSHG